VARGPDAPATERHQGKMGAHSASPTDRLPDRALESSSEWANGGKVLMVVVMDSSPTIRNRATYEPARTLQNATNTPWRSGELPHHGSGAAVLAATGLAAARPWMSKISKMSPGVGVPPVNAYTASDVAVRVHQGADFLAGLRGGDQDRHRGRYGNRRRDLLPCPGQRKLALFQDSWFQQRDRWKAHLRLTVDARIQYQRSESGTAIVKALRIPQGGKRGCNSRRHTSKPRTCPSA
jgi:hypothetical protein